MAPPTFKIFAGRDNKFYFKLHDMDGKALMTSQGFPSDSDCTVGIESARALAGNDGRWDRQTTRSGKFGFVLRSESGEAIAVGELHETVRDCDETIRRIQHIVATAGVAPRP